MKKRIKFRHRKDRRLVQIEYVSNGQAESSQKAVGWLVCDEAGLKTIAQVMLMEDISTTPEFIQGLCLFHIRDDSITRIVEVTEFK